MFAFWVDGFIAANIKDRRIRGFSKTERGPHPKKGKPVARASCHNRLIQSGAEAPDASPTLRTCGSFRRCRTGGGATPPALPFPRCCRSAAASCDRNHYLVWRDRTCGVSGGPVL